MSGQDILFNEDHIFFRDIPHMLQYQDTRRDIYLNIQVMEKPEPTGVQTDNTTVSYRHQDDTANFGNMEYNLYGWYLFKVNSSDNEILSGRFTRALFAPPMRKPPLNTEKVSTMDSQIDFTVQAYEFNDRDLKHSKRNKKDKLKAKAEEEKYVRTLS